MNQSQVTTPSQSVYINERNNADCDVHYHPWLGEVGEANGDPYTSPLPTALNQRVPIFAIAAARRDSGSNGDFCDGRALRWQPFGAMKKSTLRPDTCCSASSKLLRSAYFPSRPPAINNEAAPSAEGSLIRSKI